MNEMHLTYLASPEWAERLRADLLPWIERVGDLGDDVLEIGPGPGLTTDILREKADRVTAVELDRALAAGLSARLEGSNVTVAQGDAACLPFADDRFSAASALSMLHHVPTAAHQDAILRELGRVLRPCGRLFACDALDLPEIRAGHAGDTFVPLPLETLAARLEAAGFERVEMDIGEYEVRFSAVKPG